MHLPAARTLVLAIGVGVALGWGAPASAATYYVAPDGDNANAGTEAAPWASPAYGAARLQPGDTLVLGSGTYVLSDYELDIVRPTSGTASAWVTIRGESGGRAVLAGRDNLAAAIELGGTHYVRIENLEVTHDPQAAGEAAWFRDGISITDAPASHIVLSKVFVHHLDEFGLNAGDVDSLELVDSRIEHCGFGAFGGPAGVAGGLTNVAIRRCSLSWSGHYYQGGDGTDRPYDRPDGFGIEASAGPVLIEQTTAEHNYGDGFDSKAAATTIRRSIAANNSCDGVKLWGGGSRVENTLIYGRGDGSAEITPWAAIVIEAAEAGASFDLVNVSVDDQLGGNYLVYVQYDEPTAIQLTIRNSIFRATGPNCPIWLRDTVTLTADHNLFWLPQNETVLIHGDTEYTAATLASLGTANTSADPAFVAPAWGSTGDYHLGTASPAIDAGTTLGAPSVDLDGAARDAHPDLGAYEHGGVASGCRLECAASVPATATAGVPVAFAGSATADGCIAVPSFAWSFGDGSPAGAGANVQHTYAGAGSYSWRLDVVADDQTCGDAGAVVVSGGPGDGRPPHAPGQTVPQVARVPGFGGSLWTSELTLLNPTDAAVTTTLIFTPRDADGLATYQTVEVTVPAHGCRTWSDVVNSLFGATGAGALVVSSEVLVVSTRTSTPASGVGAYGQGALPVESSRTARLAGPTTLVAGGVIAGGGARSNLALNELWGEAATVRVVLADRDGSMLGERTVALPAYGDTQLNDLAGALAGLSSLREGQVSVTVIVGGGRVGATLSIVDPSGDPATVPLVVPES